MVLKVKKKFKGEDAPICRFLDCAQLSTRCGCFQRDLQWDLREKPAGSRCLELHAVGLRNSLTACHALPIKNVTGCLFMLCFCSPLYEKRSL